MTEYPFALSIRSTSWLRTRCRFRRHATEEYYRAQGLLDDERGVPDTSEREPRYIDPADPVLSAPLTEAAGGTIYFSSVRRDVFAAALELLGVVPTQRDFLAIFAQSTDPIASRYLDQLWLIPSVAAKWVFGLEELDLPGEQKLTVGETLHGFVDGQIGKWIEPGRLYSSRLEGALGGDGEYAREDLAFGFSVVDGSSNIYRIWSRPWIVLK